MYALNCSLRASSDPHRNEGLTVTQPFRAYMPAHTRVQEVSTSRCKTDIYYEEATLQPKQNPEISGQHLQELLQVR